MYDCNVNLISGCGSSWDACDYISMRNFLMVASRSFSTCMSSLLSTTAVSREVSGHPPPALNRSQVSALARSLFPFSRVEETSVKRLESYDDKNYYFCGVLESLGAASATATATATEEQAYVLKINNTSVSLDNARGMNSMMTFLNSRGFRVPRPLTSRNSSSAEVCSAETMLGPATGGRIGSEECELVEAEQKEMKFCVRVLGFVPGELMDLVDKDYLTPRLVYSLGNYVGKMNATLKVPWFM